MMPRIPALNIVLFLLTMLTTHMAGAMHEGIDPFAHPGLIWKGYTFALPLMAILLSHELGHFFAARAFHTEATLPYFIPVPTFIGTFGAIIKMKSPIFTRTALIHIGATGPHIGFVLSVLASIAGLALSEIKPLPEGYEGLVLGDSILFSSLSRVILGPVPQGFDVFLHPMAFAGWLGLFVTALNLLPIGQLDGGHVVYAFAGPERHRKVSLTLVAVLGGVGLLGWPGWTFWAVLLLALGVNHPPVMFHEPVLPKRARISGVLALIIFVLCFTPIPFDM